MTTHLQKGDTMNQTSKNSASPEAAVFDHGRSQVLALHANDAPQAGTDPAAAAAAMAACQVSAMLAAAAMSLTNLRPDAMPRLLQRR